MAKRKNRKRRNPVAVARRNPPTARPNPHRKRRRYRRNPPGGMLGGLTRGVVPFAVGSVLDAGEAIVGKVGVRTVRRLLKQEPGTMMGTVIEAGSAIVGGLLLRGVNPRLGANFARGGVQAPMETLIQNLGIKGVSDQLADDGYYLGGDTGVTLVSAYPDSITDGGNGGMGRYVEGAGMGQYVDGLGAE
jgi:hypothetical protein